MTKRALVFLALTPLAAACEIHDGENPVITIVSPADGALNDSSSIQISVDVDRFTLDPEIFPPDDDTHSEAFKGHWHLYLDRFFVDDQFATDALLTNVDPGVHEIAAELVNQNHAYIHGTPVAFSYVEIPATAPRIVLTEPDDGDTINSSSADLVVDVENVVLSTSLGGPNVAGEGHFHVRVDGSDPIECTDGFLTVTDLVPPSSDALSPVLDLELVQNDHSAFATPVLDRVRVNVPATAPKVGLTSPLPGAVVGTSLVLDFSLGNFQMVDFTTVTAESNGQGHYHVIVDGLDAGHGFSDPSMPVLLTPGDHVVRFELRSNLHDPLVPPVVDIVHVTAD